MMPPCGKASHLSDTRHEKANRSPLLPRASWQDPETPANGQRPLCTPHPPRLPAAFADEMPAARPESLTRAIHHRKAVEKHDQSSLRNALGMKVSSSSSSDADNLPDDAELQVSSGSMMMTEAVLDGVPNAQNTDDIAGPTRDVGDDKAYNNSKENSDENSDAADSGDLQSSDNDDSSEPDPEEKEGS
ncbi:hypothetical protein PInf_004534 [Phytophthora infestans]|nr:hypothetical protein PInf_004534 [Phytophthora infestans]